MIMGLKVVKLNGRRYGWGSVILRNTLRVVDGLPFLYLIGIIFMGLTRHDQRLGDLTAGTLVVRAASLAQTLPDESDTALLGLAEPAVQIKARWKTYRVARMGIACFIVALCFGTSAFILSTVSESCVGFCVDIKHYEAGVALQQEGLLKEAIAEYDQAIRLAPKFTSAYNNRGAAYNDSGQPERAIQDFDVAIRLDPQHVNAYRNRGNAYMKLGKPERAIQDYNEAIRLDPEDANTFNKRGIAYFRLGQYERAIEDYDEAIQLAPRFAPYYNRGMAYFNQGLYDRAIEDYDEAIRLDPQIAISYANRALAYTRLGKDQEAQLDVARAVELGISRAELETEIAKVKARR